MLKIEDSKKIIEYKGSQFELEQPSAKMQTEFATKVEKEKEPLKQVELMVEFVSSLGVAKSSAEKMGLKALQSVIEYVSDAEKK